MSYQEKPSYRPGAPTGALIGAMLTIAFIAILFAGWKLAGLPFVPFDVFDWLARVLPAPPVEFVIGTMVTIIRGLHLGPTSVVAKQIEQGMGIFNLFITGIIVGAILYAILKATGKKYAYPLGVVLGIIVGVPAVIISSAVGKTASATPVINGLWIICVFLIWGAAFGWVYRRLSAVHAITVRSGEEAAPEPASARRITRRKFIVQLAGSTAVITVAGAIVGALSSRHRGMGLQNAMTRWSATHSLPNVDAAVMPAPGTRREYTPLQDHYRIDINTFPPMIDEKTWRLKLSGLVVKPLSFTLDDLRQNEPMHQFITLSCISNPLGGDLIGTIRWTGISLQRLLPDWGIKPEATHLMIRSVDDFFEVVPLDMIRSDPRIMLTYEWDGVPLLADHGFPLRIYIPDRYGMKQPKWIESIEATDQWEPGYWVVRGWDRIARMKTTSVIDTVAVKDIIKSNGQTLVPIGGIAHAGAREISKVELKVDDGPWAETELRTPLSGLTWVIWRYNWPFQPGEHTFTVRCYDGAGTLQVTESAPPYPSGATGLYSERKDVGQISSEI